MSRPNIHTLKRLHDYEITPSPPPPSPRLARSSAFRIGRICSPTDLWEKMWTDAHRLKVIKVGADWCAPCKKVSPCFAKLASSLNNVDCFTVDVTDKTDVDGVWSVFKAVGGVKLPYFALYKDHQRVEGVQTSNIDVVKGLVQKHLAADKTEASFVEPLLKDDIDRFVLFPLKNKPLWDMYKKHESTFWTAEELDLEQDRRDFDQKLNDNERYFIKHVLAFFAASDAIVNENLVQNFMDEVQSAEARCFYGFQIMIENIHCCSGDTVVLTDKGHFPLDLLANKGEKVNAWNGYEWSEVLPQLVKEEDDMMLVQLSNGASLKCTPDHKWILQDGDPRKKQSKRVETKHLEPGDKLFKWELPIIKEGEILEHAYTNGFFSGDGSHTNGYPNIVLYGEKKNLFEFLENSPTSNPTGKEDKQGRIKFYLTKDTVKMGKYYVPINGNLTSKLEWLAGFADADGCANTAKSGMKSMQLTSTHIDFLKNIQLMLTTLGVETNISLMHHEREALLPDGNGGRKLYECKACWVIYISCCGVETLRSLGFAPKRLDISPQDPNYKLTVKRPFVKVESVTALPDKEPTYCFNEPKNHTGMFNGIMTGQSETYSLLIDNLIGDKEEKKHLFNAIKTVPIIKKKAEWCFRWTDRSQASFAERLVAFSCVEGIFFSGSFCAVFWLKKRGILPGVTFSNQLISRDEGLHCDFACLLYSQLERKLDQDRVHQIVDSAVQMECEFVSSALPVSLIGMNAKLMCQYIRFCADRLIEALGYDKKYKTTNPFEWMTIISLQNKTNFFESRTSEYAKAGVGVEDDEGFTLDADF